MSGSRANKTKRKKEPFSDFSTDGCAKENQWITSSYGNYMRFGKIRTQGSDRLRKRLLRENTKDRLNVMCEDNAFRE